jgi:hypothetical protein
VSDFKSGRDFLVSRLYAGVIETNEFIEKFEAHVRKHAHEGVNMGEVSDGFHTFNELYEHRCSLFLALMAGYPRISWISKKHEDGSEWGGWFIAGMQLRTGDVTYHLPSKMWDLAVATEARVLSTAPHWDGHTPANVVERLQAWARGGAL